ncbi:MAG: phosphate ABC transporter permease subunit PstC, partial [Rubrivivax sp.]|nr:phosphate ABC transporter permease subunit PstC [Rubrivivax sp.]
MVAVPYSPVVDTAVDPTRLKYKLNRNLKERFIELVLLGCGLVAVFTTVAITAILVYESLDFFKVVSVWDFITGTVWTPLFENPQYGILPLVSGTLTITAIALLVAVPMGTV